MFGSTRRRRRSRYLQFEKWWGDFVLLRGEEMQWMVDNLFHRQQILDWPDRYHGRHSPGHPRDQDADRVFLLARRQHHATRSRPLTGFSTTTRASRRSSNAARGSSTASTSKAGHLAIFVGTKVAEKNHAEFINNMELIEAMPPGLYEIVITEKPGSEASTDAFDVCIEERSLDDIRALGCNSLEDEREFAAVARVSELNNALYQTFVQPWIKMVDGPQLARAAIELNPLRLGYSALSDRNPMMRPVSPIADYVRAHRTPASAGNPFITMQQQFSQAMVDSLEPFS